MIRRWAPVILAILGAAVIAASGVAGWAALRNDTAAVASAAEEKSDAPVNRGGYQVFLDAQGNRMDHPHPAAPPIKSLAESAPAGKSLMKNGGYKVDLSHVRMYQKATVDESGKLSTECVTTPDAVK